MNIIETNFKFNSNHSMRGEPLKAIVLHHAASTSCTARDIHSWHLARGYAGIGYHFFVDKNGNVYRGRPESWKGAHTEGYNHYLGICAEGNFESDTMCDKQKNAIIELIKYLNQKYGKLDVYRHRDLDSTACPGKNYLFKDIVNLSNQNSTTIKTKDINTEDKTVNLKVRELGIGDTGEDVKSIQRLIGFTSNNDIDGIFGQNTLAKVKAFQKNNGLEADGVVGTLTWNKLLGG